MATENLIVSASSGDAHEGDDGNNFNSSASTLNASSNTSAANRYNAGCRFGSVSIPYGAKISAAVPKYYFASASFDDVNVDIYCEKHDSPLDFSTNPDVTSRNKTSASASWVANSVAGGGLGYYDGPDIATAVQEIVSRDGWSSGNAMVILTEGKSDINKSFRFATYDGLPAYAFKLDITYSIPAAAYALGSGLDDDFDRANSASLGSEWNEINEIGDGLVIDDNALECAPASAHQTSRGTAFNVNRLYGNIIKIEFSALTKYIDATDDMRMSVYARNDSATGIGECYRLDFDAQTNNGAIYRLDSLGTETLISGSLDINLLRYYQKYTWQIDDQSGQVQHKLYIDDVLKETLNDTDNSRITGSGYVGFKVTTVAGAVALGTGDARRINIDWMRAYSTNFSSVGRGVHRIYNSYTTVGRGRYSISVSGYGPFAGRGAYKINNRITTIGRGRHKVYNSFTMTGRGVYSYYVYISTRGRGRYRFAINISSLGRGRYRVANDALDRYELFRGVGASPDLTGSAWETFTSLPHTTATLAVSNKYYFVLRKRNQYDLSSLNVAEWVIELDASGNRVDIKPSDPDDMVLMPAASGAVNATAIYSYGLDGSTNQADTWLIYLTSDGTDPDPAVDTPTEVTMAKADGVAKLNWTSATFADGMTIKVILRTRRSDTPDVDSSNTAIMSTISDTEGPATPDPVDVHFGSAASENQGGV